jgi:hypothetical protein
MSILKCKSWQLVVRINDIKGQNITLIVFLYFKENGSVLLAEEPSYPEKCK